MVFYAGNHPGSCPLAGLWQGFFRVKRDSQLGIEDGSNHVYLLFIGMYRSRLLERTSETMTQPVFIVARCLDQIH